MNLRVTVAGHFSRTKSVVIHLCSRQIELLVFGHASILPLACLLWGSHDVHAYCSRLLAKRRLVKLL